MPSFASSLLARSSTDCLFECAMALFLWLAGCLVHGANQQGDLLLLLGLQVVRYRKLSPVAYRSGLVRLGQQVAGFHVQSLGECVKVVNEDSLSPGFDTCQGCSRDSEEASEFRLGQVQTTTTLPDNAADGLVNWLQVHAGKDHIHA